MAMTTRSMRAATVCLLLLQLVAAASARTEAVAEDGASPPLALSDEKPPDGHLSFRIVKGILEKVSGRSARLDLERGKDEKW
ncbi:unnamed protein product [Alopecurus aequalis]